MNFRNYKIDEEERRNDHQRRRKIDGLTELPPENFDRYEIISTDEEFQRITSGKYGEEYKFEVCGKKIDGSALGSMYYKNPTSPKNGNKKKKEKKKWMGKLGLGCCGDGVRSGDSNVESPGEVIKNWLNSDSDEIGKETEMDMNRSTILEFVANNLYRLFSLGKFETTKMRLCRLPVMNEFLLDNALAQVIAENFSVSNCLRIMCKWCDEYRDFGTLKVKIEGREYDVMHYIKCTGRVPELVLDPEDSSREVKVEGLMTVLACASSLGDLDFLGTMGKNAGYILERDSLTKEVKKVRIVKIDPGMCFSYESMKKERLKCTKDILFCTNFLDKGVEWDKLSQDQKNEFLEAKLHHYELTKDPKVFNYMFYRNGRFSENFYDRISKQFANRMAKGLAENIRKEVEIYGEDIVKYTLLKSERVGRNKKNANDRNYVRDMIW